MIRGEAALALATRHRQGDLSALVTVARDPGPEARVRGLLALGSFGRSGADVVLMPAPLAHISGVLNGVLVPGAAGMRTVLMERWDPEHALALIERERVTFMVGPPTFFVGLMDTPGFDPRRVASLRLISSGGAHGPSRT